MTVYLQKRVLVRLVHSPQISVEINDERNDDHGASPVVLGIVAETMV